MNCKIFRSLALWTMAVLMIFSLAACKADGTADMGYVTEKVPGYAENESITVTDTSVGSSALSDRKIIENIELTVQTKTFDALLEGVGAQIEALGGYVESSNISGREIDSYNNRSADMKIRIPAEHSDVFSDYMSENSVVVNRSVTTEDVTLTYVDIESRLTALKAEKASLETLLENASTVADIIDIRDRLTEVIGEIESYTSQLRTYDNLVDYCTMQMYIYEVERTAVVEEQNVWQEIGTNISNNFANMWNGLVDVFVFVMSSIPYLIPGVVIAGAVIVILVIRKRSIKNKTAKNQESEEK